MITGDDNAAAVFEAYTTKRVEFRYRELDLRFSLSHGLFSSSDIDAGSRLLLKAVSGLMDSDLRSDRALPMTMLDAGCGVGVLGIAVARALGEAGNEDCLVRAQDRDELARVFSIRNALANGLAPNRYKAYAERLLDGPEDARYDLILSNLPAKAGNPVLADFFFRSGRMLTEHGRCAVVIVNSLAASARAWMRAAEVPLLEEEAGSEHTVFVTGAAPPRSGSLGDLGERKSAADPYFRAESGHELENVRYSIRAVHGVADFSEASRAVVAAAKLAVKFRGFDSVLVHECEQGHFPVFLTEAAKAAGRPLTRIALCGRNVLALEAARHNVVSSAGKATVVETVPMADLGLFAGAALAGGGFGLVASFPDIVPRTERFAETWNGAATLTAPGGYFLIAAASTDAARFDKLKTKDFARAGDFKRDGFRALAYTRNGWA